MTVFGRRNAEQRLPHLILKRSADQIQFQIECLACPAEIFAELTLDLDVAPNFYPVVSSLQRFG